MPATVQNARTAAGLESISELLAAKGRAEVVDIANRLGVAQKTIRRDLTVVTDSLDAAIVLSRVSRLGITITIGGTS